ncbi:MAG TPA: nuclear transport factor 2 family protein [Bdellovibrionota bacterium]|jgi:hypothetical protein
MDNVSEVQKLEEKLRLAELGPDPAFFAEMLDDDALMDGQKAKAQIVAAHTPGSGKGQKFTKVEMSDFQFVDHGNAVVVTCKGTYEGPAWSGALKFMRVWCKKNGGWKIIAASLLK